MLETPEERVLDSALAAYQLHARVTDNTSYCGRWQEPEPAMDACVFHLVDKGECLVESDGLEQPQRLAAGDLIVFPRGAAHRLSGDSADYTTLLCGEFDFVCGTRNPLLEALPECLIVREREAGTAFRRLGQLLSEESHSGRIGSRAVMDKLADSLFVMTVRHYLDGAPQRRGLLAALADGKLSRTLAAIHGDPGRNWTVASLAAVACMSRTAFAGHFAATLGTGPYQYLTQWRMMEALKLLQDPGLSVLAIAERLGYQTEAAFRHAFKRVHGSGPGSFRRPK